MTMLRTAGLLLALTAAGALCLTAAASDDPIPPLPQNDQGEYCMNGVLIENEWHCSEWGTPITDEECQDEWAGSYADNRQQCRNVNVAAEPISNWCDFQAECCYASASSQPPPQCQPNSPWVSTEITIEKGQGWKVCVTGVGEFRIQGLGRGC